MSMSVSKNMSEGLNSFMIPVAKYGYTGMAIRQKEMDGR